MWRLCLFCACVCVCLYSNQIINDRCGREIRLLRKRAREQVLQKAATLKPVPTASLCVYPSNRHYCISTASLRRARLSPGVGRGGTRRDLLTIPKKESARHGDGKTREVTPERETGPYNSSDTVQSEWPDVHFVAPPTPTPTPTPLCRRVKLEVQQTDSCR